VLARAKGTSVGGLVEAGVVDSGGGQPAPAALGRDTSRLEPHRRHPHPVWEALHHLIRALNQDGETAAGALLARMPAALSPARPGLPPLHPVRTQRLGRRRARLQRADHRLARGGGGFA
jgi:hypothetical protein